MPAPGCPFPPAVYIGQPGWKEAGGRISYSLTTGVVIFALCVLGFFPLVGAVLPIPAMVPILLFIGLVLGAQSFRAVPKAYYPAVVIAMVPNVAAWGVGQVDNALAAAGGALTLVGLIHSAEVHVFSGEKVALGYGFAAIVCLAFA